LAAGAILAVGSIAIYARTFAVPLLFDDRTWLTDNPSIRHLGALGTVLSPRPDSGVGGRPLLNLTYALNYAAGGTDVAGYHVVNLLIHVLAAWTLFALVRRTLLRPILADKFGPAATPLALAVTAIWAWHPVQTEAVTYLAQRSELLMGLCYFLTLYCFLRGAEAEGTGGRRIWFSLSVLSCLAGVGSKEVIATAPLIVFLYDRTFLSGSFSGAWRRHGVVLLTLAATWLPLGFLMAGLSQRGVGFGPEVSWWAYGLVESRVVVRYLILAFWPRPLIFDYGAFVAPHLAAVWPYIAVQIALLAATAAAVRRVPAAGFAAAWFFLILAPSSSVVPVVAQPMAESRLYLPLAGIAALVVLEVFALSGRRCLPFFAIWAAGLGVAAAARNQDYRSERAIWADTVSKNPQNARAHSTLAAAWMKLSGHRDDAIAEFNSALRLNPNLPGVYNDLGNIWYATPGRMADAIADYKRALQLNPAFPEAHNNLGNVLLGEPGQLDSAIAQYREAIRLKPDYVDAHFSLALALLRLPGRSSEARSELETVLRLRPGDAAAKQLLAPLPASPP